MKPILPSELILNLDNSVFHLHVRGENVADTVILVGDPDRSRLIATYFDKIEFQVQNREFVTFTGVYRGSRLTVMSTGIGCDNIDIVMTELDAAVNVDPLTRRVRSEHRSLRVLRLGTSGAVQDDLKIGDYVIAVYTIGIDGLANFYKESSNCRLQFVEQSFVDHMKWNENFARPYCVANDKGLVELFSGIAKRGITVSAGGFYAPQGRVVRLSLAQENLIERFSSFGYNDCKITNIEMESAAIAAMGAMLGHSTLTVCAIIAQRKKGEGEPNYKNVIETLIEKSLLLLSK